ncbi:MAG: MFS transporter [Flavobacteriales bacterium]|nr:MFS transporter [Flavobacteriales bacterium]
MAIELNNKKTISAWTMYDWANSVYPLVITSAIFPIFYEKQEGWGEKVVEGKTIQTVDFFGHNFVNTELYSYVISLSYLILVFLSPLLSGIADYSGSKKSYMRFFCYLGALACMTFYFFDVNYIGWGLLSVLLGSIGFSGSLVFYNAYLPEIATPDLHDKVSAKGFSRGYIGSSSLLIICLVLIQVFKVPAQYAFVLTGIWWIGFSQITFRGLPNNVYGHKPQGNRLTKGFQELKKVWQELKHIKALKRYMAAFFVYSMGVQTIMIMAVFFGTKEILWNSPEEKDTGLIISILVIQFIAVAGAYLTAYMSKKIGNIKALGIIVFVWVLICVGSYALVHKPIHFYIAAASIGFVMGGIQSLSRSTYSKLLPETEDHASYFSFYDVLEKVGIVIGTFGFGFIEGQFSIRESVLMLIVFFIVGFLLLLRVPKTEALQGR